MLQIDWLVLCDGVTDINWLKEKKKLRFDFNCKFIPETAVKNPSKISLWCLIQNCQNLSIQRAI